MTPEEKFNLAIEHQHAGRYAEAETLYRDILRDMPVAEIFNNLALALDSQGKFDQAEAEFLHAVQARDDYAQGYLNLGNLLLRLNRHADAIPHLGRAAKLDPQSADALNALGNATMESGNLFAAARFYERAIALKPEYVDPHNNLGIALERLNKLDEAAGEFRKAISINPQFNAASFNLAGVLHTQRKFAEAITLYKTVLSADSQITGAWENLATALKETGDIPGAIDCYHNALAIHRTAGTMSNLVYAQHFLDGSTPATIRAEHEQFNEAFCKPLTNHRRTYRPAPLAGRKLRIGYVSPDFRFHSVGRFVLPLLKHRDVSAFETICYSDVRDADAMTRRIQEQSDGWRDTADLSHEALAAVIAQDRVDILIDLTAHMDRNRMLMFARKPCAMQVTFLAYCSTTGLETMDYRISDPHLDPPERSADAYIEKTLTLPETYWCYEPMSEQSAVSPLPALKNGYVTFGCLNNFAKVSPRTLEVWFELMRRVPNSRLCLYAPDGAMQRVTDVAGRHGISADRIIFAPFAPFASYMAQYEAIDIALDPFPYAGGTTTCDALWMGVPVITLVGQTAVSRAGLSILSNIELNTDSHSHEEYVDVAVWLAEDLPRLAELRTNLREMMRNSPLMNAPKFAADFENLLRTEWLRNNSAT